MKLMKFASVVFIGLLLIVAGCFATAAAQADGMTGVEVIASNVFTSRVFTDSIDVRITGEIKNVSDHVIDVTSVVYRIYNADGLLIRGGDSIEVYPRYLNPGEHGYFSIDSNIRELREGETPLSCDVSFTYAIDNEHDAHRLHVSQDEIQTPFHAVRDGWYETILTSDAIITSDLPYSIFAVQVVYVLRDKDGNIRAVESGETQNFVGIPKDGSIVMRTQPSYSTPGTPDESAPILDTVEVVALFVSVG